MPFDCVTAQISLGCQQQPTPIGDTFTIRMCNQDCKRKSTKKGSEWGDSAMLVETQPECGIRENDEMFKGFHKLGRN